MEWDPLLLLNAVMAGLLLGGFYAAISVGITVSFGMLDIVNIAHPGFIVVGAFLAWGLQQWAGLDPLLSALLLAPLGFVIGHLLYRFYNRAFERRGDDSLQGLAFFFGLLFVLEVLLVLLVGVDYRAVQAPYIGPVTEWGEVGEISIAWRMAVPFAVSVVMVAGLYLLATRTFLGRSVLAVAQDAEALRLLGGDPVRVKALAFGVAVATALMSGALLIIIQPVEPSLGREFIGRVFAVCVLGGLGSLPGTLVAGVLLGVAETLTATFVGPSWAPAVAFTLLLLTLAIRPAGLLGR